MTITVGVNVGHDAGIAVLDYSDSNQEQLSVYEAERFSKVKHQCLFPVNTLRTAILEKEQITTLSPDNFATCCYSVGASEKENSLLGHGDYTQLLAGLGVPQFSIITNPHMTELSHHLCHAYSALYFSPFEESIIVVADGIGSHGDAYKKCLNDSKQEAASQVGKKDFESISVYLQKGSELKLIKKIWGKYNENLDKDIFLNDGLGSYFAAAANYLFGSWAEAGKVMGLSAYGDDIAKPESIIEYLKSELSKPRTLYKGKKAFDGQPEESFKRSATISKVLQHYFEDYVLDLVAKLKSEHPQIKNIIMTGGCALNCLTTSKIVDSNLFDQVFVPPCPNDEGISIGAAYFKALEKGYTKFTPRNIDGPGAYLGSRSIENVLKNEAQVMKALANYNIEKINDSSKKAAQLICQGEVIAWFQGRSECGPRALGNRSILSLPGIKGRKEFINDHIKFRESFRPYGCSVTLEDSHRYFKCPKNYHMPYMSFAPYIKMEMKDFLSEVTHIDNTCRIQTISKNQNEKYYRLIKHVESIQGHPLLLNTSLNIMGQPILETLSDANHFFKTSKIRYMFVGDYLITK